jgi:hypothetical protein
MDLLPFTYRALNNRSIRFTPSENVQKRNIDQ